MTHLLHDGLRRLGISPPLQAASLGETFRENVSTAAAARESQGANLALRCDVSVGDRRVTGRLELVDTRSGDVLRRETLRSEAPRGFLEGALVRAAGMLGVGGDSLPAAELMGLGDEGPGTLDFYLNGLGHLQSANDSTSVATALDWFQLARRTDPGSAMSVAGIAGAERRMYRATRNEAWLERAVETARSAIALDSTRASARQELALALWTLDRRDEAIESMAEAVRLDPTDEDAVLALGRFHGRLGRVDREATVYRASATERPHAWKPHYWLATRVHYEHGHFDDARTEFAEVVRLAPDHHIGYESLGGLQVLEGSYEKAAANLQRAIELHPSPEALTNLATAYFNMRDFDRAFETFNEVFRHEFVDYFVWMNLGDAYYYAPGKRSLAEDAYRQAWRLGKSEHEERPYDVSILANLAQFLPRIGEPDSARVYLSHALEAEPENPMIQYSAAIAHWQLGERGRALGSLERAVAGGHPVQWLRDSPIFDEWRDEPRFRALVVDGDQGERDG